MRLRSVLLGAVLAAATLSPAPAFAREARLGGAIDQLSDPRNQRAMSGAVAGLLEALLSIKAEPFLRAADGLDPAKPRRRIDPDATLGDLAGPDARRAPRELAQKLPVMMGAMAGMAGAMEAVLPQLEAMSKELSDRMGDIAPAED